MDHQLTVWKPPALVTERTLSLPQTYGSASASLPLPKRSFAFEKSMDFQASICRQLENAIKITYQMKPSPMSPFASPWQTMGMPPVAIRINPQTTLFVDLFNVSEFFQRVSARAQETRTTHDDPLRGADQAVAILQSTEAHGLAKYVGIFVKNFLPIHIPNSTEAHAATKYVGIFVKNGLQLGEQLNGSMPRRAMNLDAMPLSQAWETKAMPAIQEAIDKVYQTNLAENFNPNNDSRVQQFVENAVLDPLVLMPLGHIPKAVNLSARGTR
ncbi:MAG TPA: hypothetical protein VHK67_06755, partial [Rhabdochlamydiaceae bacterium]|nr:hypothetical protein [Rhabdochlamydiaceae bacterium]